MTFRRLSIPILALALLGGCARSPVPEDLEPPPSDERDLGPGAEDEPLGPKPTGAPAPAP